MFNSKYLIIGIASFLFSCNSRDGVHYTFVNTNQDDLVVAQAAADNWNKCNIIKVSIQNGGYNAYDDSEIELIHEQDLPVSAVATMTRILYRKGTNNNFQDMEALIGLLSHEMGHATGLKHQMTGIAVMSPDLNTFEVQPSDCDALKARTNYYTNDSQN